MMDSSRIFSDATDDLPVELNPPIYLPYQHASHGAMPVQSLDCPMELQDPMNPPQVAHPGHSTELFNTNTLHVSNALSPPAAAPLLAHDPTVSDGNFHQPHPHNVSTSLSTLTAPIPFEAPFQQGDPVQEADAFASQADTDDISGLILPSSITSGTRPDPPPTEPGQEPHPIDEPRPAKRPQPRKSRRQCPRLENKTPSEADNRESREREKNRKAAAKCRERVRRDTGKLEERHKEEEDRNIELDAQASALRYQVFLLKSELLKHGECEDDAIQNYIKSAARKVNNG